MTPRWKEWRLADLPMLPDRWPLVVSDSTRDQFANVRRVLNDPDVTEIICATDAGREGELIFRYIYEAAGCKKPVRRLWISSLTPDAIARGFRELREGRSVRRPRPRRARAKPRRLARRDEPLARLQHRPRRHALRRSRADADAGHGRRSRARDPRLRARGLPRGRGDLQPDRATPGQAAWDEAGLRPDASASPPVSDSRALPRGAYPGPAEATCGGSRRTARRRRASSARAGRRGAGRVGRQREVRTLPPPLLYDLTELQRHANRLYGMSAQRTLDVAQTLYERRKLLSYPRTDSRHLSSAIVEHAPRRRPRHRRAVPGAARAGTGERAARRALRRRRTVTDHHAIIPTATRAPANLDGGRARIYDLVCRRLLSAWHDDHVVRRHHGRHASHVDARTTSIASRARARASSASAGRCSTSGEGKGGAPTLPGGPAAENAARDVVDAKAVAKQTRPPPRFTDGDAPHARWRRRAERSTRRSSPTRCASAASARRRRARPIIETLLKREYVVRDGKSLRATDKGIALIVELVHANVKSPAMTGEWEAKLAPHRARRPATSTPS